jgi:azurin
MASTPLLALVSLTALLGGTSAQETAPAVVVIEIKPHPSIPLAYDKTELTAKVGSRISLTLNNTESTTQQPHNFVLIKPGKIEAVGALATAMITDPKAMEKNYIPEQSTDILAHSPLVSPGSSVTIEFILPSEPGDYPFLCTFPGHWLQMRGTFHVTP